MLPSIPIDGIPTEPEKPRGGGPSTIADNFLLGSRNHWRDFFEECWPEIGWQLLQARKRRSNTIANVREVFATLSGKPRCSLAKCFLRSEPIQIAVEKLRKLGRASGELRNEVQGLRRRLPELRSSVWEAKNALPQANDGDKASIQTELMRRAKRLGQHCKSVRDKETECVTLETNVPGGEVYVYCSELLAFLHATGKRKRALTPINLASALAGLPDMRWRQSDLRCVRLQKRELEDKLRLISEYRRAGHSEWADQLEENVYHPQHPYAMFQIVEKIYRRIGVERDDLADSFRAELLKLRKREGYRVDFPCERWRDLRMAITEVSKSECEEARRPYAVTSAFLKNVARPKNAADYVLDTHEKL